MQHRTTFVLIHTFTPLPTTPLFTAAGMAKVNPAKLLVPFVVGKTVSDMMMIFSGRFAVENVEEILHGALSVKAVIATALGVAALAQPLGITTTQLNRACHQVLGHSALGVLHGRLVLEAQRDLAYTTLSVKQIALGLGFNDAGYFTRFFQRETGHTPSAWRALAAR